MTDAQAPRLARPSDLPAVAAFHNACYGDTRTADQFAWEYRGSRPAASVLAVVHDGPRVVGTQGMIPIVLNMGGELVLTGKSENTLTDPACRGKGLMLSLYPFALESSLGNGMRCIWGYTGATAAAAMLRRLSFQVHDQVMQSASAVLSGPRAVRRALRSSRPLLRRLAAAAFALIGAATFHIRRRPHVTDGTFELRTDLPSAVERAALYDRIRARHPCLVHIEQDNAYVEWRLSGNPFARYRSYAAYEGDMLRGYCYCNVRDPSATYIADVAFESTPAGAFLIERLLADRSRAGTTSVHFLGSMLNPPMREVLELLGRFGFRRRPGAVSFVLFVPPDRGMLPCAEIGNWYLSGLWTDGSRY